MRKTAKSNKDERKKSRIQTKRNYQKWYHFFNKWTWFGVIIVLISIILGLKWNNTGITILSSLLQTIGIALIIGAIFDFSKSSSEFTEFISSLLSDIIISKSFLKRLSANDKEEALNLILQPSENQLEQYSNINEYFKKQIVRSTQMFNTNFKSNVVINIDVKKEEGKVVSKGKISYRIYKVSDTFEPIKVKFERNNSTITGKRIIFPGGSHEIKEESAALPIVEAGVEYKQYEFKIPDDLNSYSYLTIESDIEEIGYDHWTNFHWTSLTPYDGLTFRLKCDEGLVIQEYIVFDEKSPYFVRLSENKNDISILSTEWLNAYTGFSLTIGEKNDV